MALAPGTHLGPYEILAPLGAGGMGEVYRARDTRLDRTVAIKVLPQHLADTPEARQRFEREARAVSALNHPHICTLHDVGSQDGTEFLVMEYLEGETLAVRLEKGPLPLEQALKLGVEISDALDKAHRQGIIHRDLKPGNIMLTKSGAKLLDFGLAKAVLPLSTGVTLTAAVTRTTPVTQQGTIVGTFQYMSPEQVEGKEADARSDIFSFGAVLYEMVTGRRAFPGKSQLSVASAILEKEPEPISTLKPMTPPALDRAIRVCLAKDPDGRWQTASDLVRELKWIAEGGSQAGIPAPIVARRKTRERLLTAIAAALFVTMIGLGAAVVYLSRAPADVAATRFFVSPPEKGSFDSGAAGFGFAAGVISPDGRRLAFTAKDASGKILIWVRALDTLAPQALPGTDNAGLPFWSPDSRTIAFFSQGKLKRIEVAGGPPQTLCGAPNGRGGAWNREGLILFAPNGGTGPLYRVTSAGGDPVAVTKPTPQQTGHRFPSFLPDGRHFLYFATSPGSSENSGVFVGSLNSNESKRLLGADSNALYSAPGGLLFVRQGTLLFQSLDPKKLELSGDPTPVAELVASVAGTFLSAFSVSENGVLVYRSGLNTLSDLQLAWFDRTGKSIETFGAPGAYHGVDLSPDGTRIAVHRHDENGGDIWLFESARRTISRFTFDASQDNSDPMWSPDGSRIAYGSPRNGKWGIYQKPANGTGREELLVESNLPTMPMSWSPDGKAIVYLVYARSKGVEEWVLPLAGDRKPVANPQTQSFLAHHQISPDGKWIAYGSDETGSREIYVRPFPSGEGKWQISTNGGYFPRWRRDGKELFYMGNFSLGKMISVKVNPVGPTFEYGDPTELFDSGYVEFGHIGLNYHTYAVSPDGQRFLIPRPESIGGGETASAPITVILNWTAGLKK